MSKRSRTTLTLNVRLPLPPGATQAQALEYVQRAIKSYAGGLDPTTPMFDLQGAEIQVKISHRETVYL